MNDKTIERFMNTGIVSIGRYKLRLKRSDIRNMKPNFLIKDEWVINTTDKKLWIGDENDIPVQYELKLVEIKTNPLEQWCKEKTRNK